MSVISGAKAGSLHGSRHSQSLGYTHNHAWNDKEEIGLTAVRMHVCASRHQQCDCASISSVCQEREGREAVDALWHESLCTVTLDALLHVLTARVPGSGSDEVVQAPVHSASALASSALLFLGLSQNICRVGSHNNLHLQQSVRLCMPSYCWTPGVCSSRNTIQKDPTAIRL